MAAKKGGRAMAARLAVVTGGAGDIGQAIARRLLRDHDAVLLADRDLALAEDAARDLGPGCTAIRVDVTDPASCADLAAAAAGAGGVATLVNNAGAAAAVSLHGTDAASWQADRALNLDAAYYVFSALAD